MPDEHAGPTAATPPDTTPADGASTRLPALPAAPVPPRGPVRVTAKFVVAGASDHDAVTAVVAGAGDGVTDDVTLVPPPAGDAGETQAVPAPSAPGVRVRELSLDKPWVANLSTALIAVGVLLVLLAVVRAL